MGTNNLPEGARPLRPQPKLVWPGIAAGALGVLLWGARWLMQGERTVWTDLSRHFYAPDTTLGWTRTSEAWVWLGLDGLVLTGALVLGALVLVWLGRRLVARPRLARGSQLLAAVAAMLGFAAPVLPVWAFLSGQPADGVAIVMPVAEATARPGARLAVTARRWQLAPPTPATLLTVRIEAGQETFDARFAPLGGTLSYDADQPSAARGELSVPAASVATGVELRDGHARGYLAAERFPTITLHVSRIVLTPDGSFSAQGQVDLMGRVLPVALAGSVVALDAAKRAELGIQAPEALIATASFDVLVSATPLERENFDSDRLLVTARVALVPAP